jgi:NAD(P)-dependent dehydrogenase (short-subunit alcohol dehydrogenase family)
MASSSSSSSSSPQQRKILVTGANQGIGFALVKRLVTEKDCFVYLGARNLAKGQAAKASLEEESSSSLSSLASQNIEVVEIDVTKPDTIQALAKQFQDKGVRYVI